MKTLQFRVTGDLEAHEPPEARGLTRSGVRLLVGDGAEVSHRRFEELPDILRPGDVLVVNTSATMPAAVPVVGADLALHFSTESPGGLWLVELRAVAEKATKPYTGGVVGLRLALPGGGAATLVQPYSRGRLWVASIYPGRFGSVLEYLEVFGAPIRYGYVSRPWPLRYYQTVFGTEPGSAEMPSASRPFTDRVVTRLVSAGVQFAPVLLHTGVASPEAHERPYPERFQVADTTARVVNTARAAGGRVVAVGTTAVRALESAADEDGVVRAASGWTDLIVTPERGVLAVDGLLTGFHEPEASHVDMLVAVAGEELLAQCYQEALAERYLWHEFGDVNLLLR
ncbi:S-adenosylmethionine:tRNA ribosyltransferase-isomerase [Actinokineospora auranticolor]|uniref:S-adenosylmethionine:tRNA ribosyltransferase-isomerase n=1 Tax=Actinokineospora auranticolor TaxID=155976 RepID=A0A2S6GCI9_9PSEU|nr:S-adenosylmethionine:tRNA ribosyltransferase-isomerase [Actinokineospora auranticolor]PPK62400.1 S-adenosylmethionine:tRNA ribosyltransferase-isomerase [Actinokineospora auranticolor]